MADGPPETLWVHPYVDVRDSNIDGQGLFATEEIAAGVILLRLSGHLVTTDELTQLLEQANAGPSRDYVDTLTVYEDAHLVLPPGSVIHFGNHSCDPNMWHVGPYAVATRRAVQADEELTVDYGTQSGGAGFSMTCRCDAGLCRGIASSNDWRLPALQDRYRNHWVPALEARITAL